MRHVVILRKIFYDMVASKQKTIESRWNVHKIAPYKKVSVGDELLIKQMGKDVTLKAIVKDVRFYELSPQMADEIKAKYGEQIGLNYYKDWHLARKKKYCTLVWLEDVEKIEPIKVKKSNGSAWFVLK